MAARKVVRPGPDSVEAAGRKTGKRRFGQLPERVNPDQMVESQPPPPTPEPDIDPNAQAIYRFGLPI